MNKHITMNDPNIAFIDYHGDLNKMNYAQVYQNRIMVIWTLWNDLLRAQNAIKTRIYHIFKCNTINRALA